MPEAVEPVRKWGISSTVTDSARCRPRPRPLQHTTHRRPSMYGMRVIARWSAVAFVVGSLVLGATPMRAEAAPTRVVPPKKTRSEKRAERTQRDFSEGGTRRGVVELTLGSLTAATSLLLIGRGAWELSQARELENACESPNPPLECELDGPARGNRIAGGLSLGLSVPFGVASGFLFAYGARIHRDWRKHQRAGAHMRFTPWATRTGGGMHLRLRF